MANVISNVMDYKVVANNVVKSFNDVNDVVAYVVMILKKYPHNAVYVNGMGIRLEREADGKIGVVLRDSDMNLIRGYVMGKIKRGMDKAVAYVMESVTKNMEENNMVDMVNNVDMFNGYIMDDVLVKDFNYAVESAEVFANEYGDFDYDYDIRQMWADWCWKNDVMSRDDAYKYYDANRDMFINEDDLCECVYGFEDTYGVGIDDNCCGSCLIWVKNPYYVSKDAVENDAPCLDEDEYDDNEWSDRDWLIKRTADTIKDYLGNYMPSYLDQFGDCVITVYWDEFSEDMIKNMIEDDNFALQVKTLVYGVGGIEGFLVYDDGIYVTVDYDRWFNKVA
jgi:hypothetical protein